MGVLLLAGEGKLRLHAAVGGDLEDGKLSIGATDSDPATVGRDGDRVKIDLGDERPLGLERDGQWVDFEHLSESERLVYGIGLVMALSTTGKGLRMVMLDGLDSCDVERRRAIVEQAVRLIKAGQLDNVLGTAWSREGFEDDSVQVIEV